MNVPLLVDHVDLFPAGFKINSYEKVIYIDPFQIKNTDQADIVLITHGHYDHLSLADIKKIAQKIFFFDLKLHLYYGHSINFI